MSTVASQSRPPLVGRDEELSRVVAALAAGRHVLLEGEAGVGKSRLADEAASDPELQGRPVDRVLASAGTRRVALAALLPLTAVRGTSDGVGRQIAWYLGRWRARRVSIGPTVLCLDDAPHLDVVSAAVVRQAVIAGDVQLLATARTHEPLPDDLLALLADRTIDRLQLEPLDREASRHLAAVLVSRPVGTDSVDRLARLAGGNPLFLRELALSDREGVLPAPGPGAAVLRDRLASLPADARHAAELVALAQPVPADLLRDLADGLDALRLAGLLVGHDGDRLRLDHPLQAEWLVDALGSARQDRYRELADRAAQAPGLVDPLVAVEWRMNGAGAVDPTEAARAARLALSRTDAAAARRLLEHVTAERDLLLGQTLALEGDLDGAIELLEQVRRETPDPALRVEAASLLVRHVGLSRDDPAGAHAILDQTDGPDLDGGLRRYLLLGRLWLRVFGPELGPRLAPSEQLVREATAENDQLAYEIASAGAALFAQTHGVGDALPLLARLRAIEKAVDVDEGAWCRTRAVKTWCHVYAGDLVPARSVLARAVARAWREGWQEGVWLLVGNAAIVGSLAGDPVPDFVPAGWDHRALDGPEGSVDGDLYRLRALAAAAWQGSCVLVDPAGACACQQRRLRDSAGAMPLLDTMVARAEALIGEARGRPGGGTDEGLRLANALRLLAENDMKAWLALFYLDGADLRTPLWVHQLVAVRFGDAGTGLPDLAPAAARARAEGDATGLLQVADDLAARGYVMPATRAYADVTRLRTDPATMQAALRGLAAADGAWHGGPWPWTRDVPDLPTRQQLEVARAIAGGLTEQQVADQRGLSRRTVEDHLSRVTRSLGAGDHEELRVVLAPRCG